MPEFLRRWLVPTVMVGLAAVVVTGLVTSPSAPVDRAEGIASRLRCPVCQGVSVADSPSDTAEAMRDRIAELIADGATDREIEQHFVDRYGEWILLDPRRARRTWALWGLPVLMLVAGSVAVWRLRLSATPVAEPTPEQRATVARLLDRADAPGGN